MDALALIALVIALVVAVWSFVERTWPLGLLALAVVFLAVSPGLSITVH